MGEGTDAVRFSRLETARSEIRAVSERVKGLLDALPGVWPDALVASEISAHGLVRNPGDSRNVVDGGSATRVHSARGIERLGTGSCAHDDLLQSNASAPARGPGRRQPVCKKLLDKTMFSTTLWLSTNVVDNIRESIHTLTPYNGVRLRCIFAAIPHRARLHAVRKVARAALRTGMDPYEQHDRRRSCTRS